MSANFQRAQKMIQITKAIKIDHPTALAMSTELTVLPWLSHFLTKSGRTATMIKKIMKAMKMNHKITPAPLP